MPSATWSVQDAKNRFSAMVEAARREPQTVTKHGKPAVVVIDAGEFARLRQAAHTKLPSLPELLLAMPQDDGAFPRLKARPRNVKF